MDTTPSDRVQLIGRSQLMHPGCCALCGSGNCEDGYVDTGIYYDYEGQVYFCMTCVEQIINVVGGFTGDQTAMLNAELAGKVTELSSVKEELETARGRVQQYDALLSGLASARDNGDVTINLGPSEVPQAEPAVTDGPAKSADTEQPVLIESGTGPRRRKPARTERSDSSTTDSGFIN